MAILKPIRRLDSGEFISNNAIQIHVGLQKLPLQCIKRDWSACMHTQFIRLHDVHCALHSRTPQTMDCRQNALHLSLYLGLWSPISQFLILQPLQLFEPNSQKDHSRFVYHLKLVCQFQLSFPCPFSYCSCPPQIVSRSLQARTLVAIRGSRLYYYVEVHELSYHHMCARRGWTRGAFSYMDFVHVLLNLSFKN